MPATKRRKLRRAEELPRGESALSASGTASVLPRTKSSCWLLLTRVLVCQHRREKYSMKRETAKLQGLGTTPTASKIGTDNSELVPEPPKRDHPCQVECTVPLVPRDVQYWPTAVSVGTLTQFSCHLALSFVPPLTRASCHLFNRTVLSRRFMSSFPFVFCLSGVPVGCPIRP